MEEDKETHQSNPYAHTLIAEMPSHMKNKNWTSEFTNFVSPTFWRQDLYKLLRKKLLQHKWGDVALIMESLCSHSMRYKNKDVFWRVGNELLYHHPASKENPSLVLHHYQNARTFHLCSSPYHILFEHTMYHLVRKDFKAAHDILQFYRNNSKWNPYRSFPKLLKLEVEKWTPIIEGYLGMLEYITWQHMIDSPDAYPENEGYDMPQSDVTAQRAVEHFQSVLSSPGVHDIFVVKQAELLEHSDRIVEVEESLRAYAEMNPTNPNAHKYLYEFFDRNQDVGDSEAAKIEALSNLHTVAPSDELMIQLHILRMKKAFENRHSIPTFTSMAGMGLEVLMNMLDYDIWLEHTFAWECLAKHLTEVRDILECDFIKILNQIWTDPGRNSWWPQYHFTRRKATNFIKLNPELARSKSTVASVFLGDDCEFSKHVRSKLRSVVL